MILTNSRGLAAEFSSVGACLKKLTYKGLEIAKDGVVVGRYANRIAGGRFSIGGTEYRLVQNEGENTNHGGPDNFTVREWKEEMLDFYEQPVKNPAECVSLRYSLVSPDGDQGFPGTLKLSVRYTLTGDNELIIKFEAVSDKDTVVNLTNHAYFNLNGGGPIKNHLIWVDTNAYTETDEAKIPTGRILPTEGTDFDLIQGPQYLVDLDRNFVLNGSGLRRVAQLKGLESGLTLSCFTDQPGMQIYNTPDRICLETQHFPDSPHHPEFPETLLRVGEKFRSTTIFKISL